MKTVFLIGGMGSGKSTVADMLVEWGAFVIDLDEIGHDVLKANDVKGELVRAFGDGVIDAADEVIRPAIAAHAFISEETAATLNSIMVPRIVERLNTMLDVHRSDRKVVVIEVSAYTGPGSGFAALADEVIAVVSDEDTRISRVVEKGFDEADVRHRIARQPTDESRRAWADYVIENNGDIEALRAKARSMWEVVSDLSG